MEENNKNIKKHEPMECLAVFGLFSMSRTHVSHEFSDALRADERARADRHRPSLVLDLLK